MHCRSHDLKCNANTIQCKYNYNTHIIQYKYNKNAIHIQCTHITNTIHIPYKYNTQYTIHNTNTIQLQFQQHGHTQYRGHHTPCQGEIQCTAGSMTSNAMQIQCNTHTTTIQI